MATIEQHRHFFARLLVESAGSMDERLIAAFAQIAREDFVGPGPWWVCAGTGYLRTPDADPRWLYQDILVGLDPERRINNGQPSLHAQCLAAAAVRNADVVVHVGAGTGYYSAILASLVGTAGRVVAFELDAELARRARENLQQLSNVEIHARSAVMGLATGTQPPFADVLYVNAGVAQIPSAWLDALKPGGRMIVPLTPDCGYGLLLAVTRLGIDGFAARGLGRAGFTPCVGARGTVGPDDLARALRTETWQEIRSLVRGESPDSSSWCVGNGWWLSRRPPTEQPDAQDESARVLR